jgi:hypothetical protein
LARRILPGRKEAVKRDPWGRRLLQTRNVLLLLLGPLALLLVVVAVVWLTRRGFCQRNGGSSMGPVVVVAVAFVRALAAQAPIAISREVAAAWFPAGRAGSAA